MKVGIIGAGNVGSATAFALVMRGVARKVVLIDANEARAKAEAADIAHASPFADASKIKAGTYEDLKGAEVVIITAGANQKPGEPRTALLERNVKIFENIIPQVVKNAPDCMLLITSNPVDIMTSLLGYHLGVSPKSIHGYVLGEHGDSEVLIWSSANAGGVQIEEFAEKIGKPFTPELKAKIDDCVRNAAYQIIDGKGSTYYGIAGALCRICQAISANEYAILTLSSSANAVFRAKYILISVNPNIAISL